MPLFHHTLHAISLIYGYLVPALQLVRAVVHEDTQAKRDLLIHFLVLFATYTLILEPLFYSGAINRLLALPFLVWLSSSTTKGSVVLYECVMIPLFIRFEGDVNNKVLQQRQIIRENAIRFMINGGAAFFRQVLDVIGSLMEGEESADEQAQQQQLNPQHSVRESLLSIRSSSLDDDDLDDDDDDDDGGSIAMIIDDEDAFQADFLLLLQRGLYVFAHTSDSSEHRTDNNAEKRVFGLKVFCFDPSTEFFRFSTVDSQHHSLDMEISLPLSEINSVVKSSSQALTISSSHILAEVVLSDSEDRDILLGGLQVCLRRLGNK